MKPLLFARTSTALLGVEQVNDCVRKVFVTNGLTYLAVDSDGWSNYRSGSRFWFRVWGMWGTHAGNRLPCRWRVRVTAARGESAVLVELASDEGAYLARLPSLEKAYEQLFSKFCGLLDQELGIRTSPR